MTSKCANYESEIEVLNEGWQILDDRLEQIERNDRLGVVIIERLRHSKEGTLKEYMCKTIKKHMNIDVKENDMIHCYRFGEDDQDSGLTRQVKIRFKDPMMKEDIMR